MKEKRMKIYIFSITLALVSGLRNATTGLVSVCIYIYLLAFNIFLAESRVRKMRILVMISGTERWVPRNDPCGQNLVLLTETQILLTGADKSSAYK